MDMTYSIVVEGTTYSVTKNINTGQIERIDPTPTVEARKIIEQPTQASVNYLIKSIEDLTRALTGHLSVQQPASNAASASTTPIITQGPSFAPNPSNSGLSLLAKSKPPCFNGSKDGMSPTLWIDCLKNYLEANNVIYNWYACKVVIPTLISGETTTKWTEQAIRQCTSFNEFKSSFEETWVIHNASTGDVNKLVDCKMAIEDSMTMYVAKKCALIHEFSGTTDEQSAKYWIRDGLDSWYKGQLGHLTNDKTVTLKEFISECHKMYQKRLMMNREKERRQETNAPRGTRCSICRRTNHETKDCLQASKIPRPTDLPLKNNNGHSQSGQRNDQRRSDRSFNRQRQELRQNATQVKTLEVEEMPYTECEYLGEDSEESDLEEEAVQINRVDVNYEYDLITKFDQIPITRPQIELFKKRTYSITNLVKLDGIEVTPLVDSGCTSPVIISESVAQKILSQHPKDMKKTATHAKLADGTTTEALKGMWVILTIGDTFTFIVFALVLPRCQNELIIGVPTIRTAKLQFDHSNMSCEATAEGTFKWSPSNNSKILVIEGLEEPNNDYLQLKTFPPRAIINLSITTDSPTVYSNDRITALTDCDSSFAITADVELKNYREERVIKLRKIETLDADGVDNEVDLFKKLVVNSQLPEESKAKLRKLVLEFEDIFQKNEDDMGLLNHYKAVIDTKDAKPIRCNYYPLPSRHQTDLESIISRLARNNVLVDNTGFWAFPVFVIYSKGKPRMLVDIRKLNALLTLFPCPLPNIREVIRQLTKSKWFTVLDMPDGYFQMELTEESREKAGIVHQNGSHMFTRVPQGLSTAVAQFMHAINLMYKDIPRTADGRKCVEPYLDDTMVHGKTIEEMLWYLEQVFVRYRQYGAKLNPRKIKIGFNEVEFLGLIVGMHGIKPDPRKLEAIQSLRLPKTLTELRSLIGTINQLAQFIPNTATLLEPFTRLTKKNHRDPKSGKFNVTRDQEIALAKIKNVLSSDLVLELFDEELKLLLEIDASNVGAGSCLYQIHADGTKHPLGYFSRKFKNYELNLTTTEKEALSIVMSTEFFRTFLLSTKQRFLIRTDHCGLCWLFKMKDYNSKCARWAIKLSFYKFDIEHISGKSNIVADHLSRFVEMSEPNEDGMEYINVFIDPKTGYEKFERFKSELTDVIQSTTTDFNNEPKYKPILAALGNSNIHKGYYLREGVLMKQI